MRHTGIVVNDIKGAISFWVDLLGFEVVSNQVETGEFINRLLGLEGVSVQTVKLRAKDRTMIELLHFKSHSSEENWNGTPYKTGLTHIAFNTSDLPTLVTLLNSHGYYAVNEIEIAPSGKVKVCYLAGFEGILLEIVETILV